MSWSVFTDGGGKGAAVTWAKDLLSGIGAPASDANVQTVYDWEVSEGAGGQYNPLNQGRVPGHPELTVGTKTVASDYASWDAGLKGAVDYLNMSNFSAIKKALIAGDAATARSAIISSPWAGGHYGQGASFSTEALPGQSTALNGYVQQASDISSAGDAVQSSVAGKALSGILSGFGVGDVKDLAERAALMLMGALVMVVGVIFLTGQEKNVKKAGMAVATDGASVAAEEAE